MAGSILSYGVTRNYPYRFFTLSVAAGGLAFLALFSFINLTSSGFTLIVQYSSEPNTTVNQNLFYGMPNLFASKTKPSCQPSSINGQTKIATTNNTLLYTVTSVQSYGNGTLLPSLVYLNNPFESCNVSQVAMYMESLGGRTAAQIAVAGWGVTILGMSTCRVELEDGPVIVNMTAEWDPYPSTITTFSGSASFVTAWTSAAQGEADSNNAVRPRRLMVHGIGREPTVLQSSEFRYGHQLMVAVEEIPLLISGVEHYTKSAQTIRSMWDRPEEFRKISRWLCLQNWLFQYTLEFILSESVGVQTLQAVLAQPGGQAWREAQVEQELRRFLQGSYTVFLQLVVDMHGALVAFTRRLRLGPDGPLNKPKSFREAYERFRFALKKSTCMDLVEEVSKVNTALSRLVQQIPTPKKFKSEAT
ncbi:hypothetical protein Q7P36_006983 [Cladosporium allicinum]